MVDNKHRTRAPGGEQIAGVRDPVLAKVTNRMYRGFDLDYPDVERAKVFLSELAEYEKTGSMPRLIVMRLGNDHTNGDRARQARAAFPGRRQRLRAGHDRGGRFEIAILDQHGDLRAGRRRAERAGPRGFAPLAGVR